MKDVLRIIYNDKMSNFDGLSVKNNFIFTHNRNIQMLDS